MNLLYRKYGSYSKDKLNMSLVEACSNCLQEDVKYLLSSNDLFYLADIEYDDHAAFINACKTGSIELVRYLLTSSEIAKQSDINAQDSSGLSFAALMGHFDLVKYLLTSPELKEHANINADDSACFSVACREGYKDIMKYLLTSPDLKEKTNLSKALMSAYLFEDMETAQFIIFELNVEKNQALDELLNRYTSEYRVEIENMFKVRELKNKLSNNLPINNNKQNKNKI